VRILIADDDLTSRTVLRGVLVRQGYDVEVTTDGESALAAMTAPSAPNVAILDWMMPALPGPEVCRRIRAIPSDKPPYLILLTVRDEKSDIVEGLEAGADDYLSKPFDAAELRARIEVGRRIVDLQANLIETRDALSHLATHDSLTSTLNRRAFSEALRREMNREGRQAQGMALAVLDIDDFKGINDRFGHQAGDEVLCGIVGRLTSNLRSYDVLGRLGGDEFVILANHVGRDEAASLFDRLRVRMAESPVPTRAGPIPVTVTAGVALWRPGQSDDDLYAAADAALYTAKAEGRNRVAVFPERPTLAA
jgi:two-component system, cell cycle response regulator